jgi:predicted tellurium resistance membrane protein TerC
LGKSTLEIHHKLEAGKATGRSAPIATSFAGVIVQILLLDIVFSFDSVITAVGMVDQLTIMVAAVVLATIVMMVFAAVISSFVERHLTFKMLALGFLLLVGVMLGVQPGGILVLTLKAPRVAFGDQRRPVAGEL